MSDEEKKEQAGSSDAGGSGDELPSGRFALTALLAVIAGGAMIVAFFLPVLVFKPATLENFDEARAELENGLDLVETALDEAQEQGRPLHASDVDDNERLRRIFGDGPITHDEIDDVRTLMESIATTLHMPTLWNVYNTAARVQKLDTRLERWSEGRDIPVDTIFGWVMGIRVALVVPPGIGLLAIAFALINRFRKLNVAFLIILFFSGAAVAGTTGLLTGAAWAWENADQIDEGHPLAGYVPDQPIPFVVGPGTHLSLGAGLGFVAVGLFGVSRRNAWICYSVYLLSVVGIAAGLIKFVGDRYAERQAQPEPGSVAPLEPGGPVARPVILYAVR